MYKSIIFAIIFVFIHQCRLDSIDDFIAKRDREEIRKALNGLDCYTFRWKLQDFKNFFDECKKMRY